MSENHLTQDEPTGSIEGIDADALLNEIESGGNTERPMTTQQEGGGEGKPATPPPAAAELEFDYQGKAVKVPYTDPRAKQWAQQGYDYSQRMAAFKQEREKWESERKAYDPYKTVDQYAKENPDWWQHVMQAYQSRTSGQAQGAASPDLQAFQKELQELKQFKATFEEKQTAERIQKEDSQLDAEIKSIREQHKDLDWDGKDENGQTLEQRVIAHAMKLGFKGYNAGEFRAAFRDYNHDHFLKLAQERGKEAQQKELQKRTKLGIIGTSPTPKKGVQSAEGVKNKNYNDLLAEAKEELGIA